MTKENKFKAKGKMKNLFLMNFTLLEQQAKVNYNIMMKMGKECIKYLCMK